MNVTIPLRRAERSFSSGRNGDRASQLAAALRQVDAEVRFDQGGRALYATDGSNYRQVPIGVVLPKTTEAVVATMATCRRFDVPVLARGCGTSLVGQTCNTAVVIDFSKYLTRVLDIDPKRRRARVEPGTIRDDLAVSAERFNLTFAPDPGTHNRCTLGGMLGNNSGGSHSLMGGLTDDNTEELEILTYDGLRMRVGATSDEELARLIAQGGRQGQIYRDLRALRDRYADQIRDRFPQIPRRVSGYNLDQLLPEQGFHVARALVGSEGTCVTVLEATLRLVESPPFRALLVLGYSDIYAAADHISPVLAYQPIVLEGLDERIVRSLAWRHMLQRNVAMLPPGQGWLFVQFGGQDQNEANQRGRTALEGLKRSGAADAAILFEDPGQQAMVWDVREAALGATKEVPDTPETWEGWDDSSVAPDRFPAYLRDFGQLLDRYGYFASMYGHFGQGLVHSEIDFDLLTRPGIDRFLSFLDDATDLVVRYGGSYSGEHGDGQAKAAYLEKMYGPELMRAFREFKAIWDPGDRMNPGKLVDPYLPDQNLRLGADYEPWQPATHFSFSRDGGSFARAARRCVGIGKCRRLDGGTMCPSYMVTRQEEHSTRGRAHLLFEMLQGEVIAPSWRDDAVRESLDLCLACKGCRGECPAQVDMATYKAEFLSHYYQGRLRPRAAYAMGLIYWWSRLASRLPAVTNLLTQTPGLSRVMKSLGGIAPQRQVPGYAAQTFRDWFAGRATRNPSCERVILWPDTFNNFFHPETAKAAVEVIEHFGFQVIVPGPMLCCGRPLYDFGMLDLAERQLRQIIAALRPEIRAGTPLIGLEPSCLVVFRDELTDLLPHDLDARRLSGQAFLLSEFLDQRVPDDRWPRLTRRAIVHGHCHHTSIIGMAAEERVLGKLGLDFQTLDSGCCGMAGSFGFERGDKYDVSIAAGERVLLPAVRQADKDTLIIANGFSCREQIRQETDRQALHLAQVIRLALEGEPDRRGTDYPERALVSEPARLGRGALMAAGATVAAGAAARQLLRRRAG